MGRAACAMEARGEKSYLGDLNRDIKETNKLLAYLRRNFKKLQGWVKEKIEAAKEQREEKKLEKNPPINGYLYSWILIRNEERAHWKNRTVVLKRMAQDMMHISEATMFLREQKIFTVEDMKAKLEALQTETGDIDAELKKANKRLKNISTITETEKTLEQLQPIHDQYSHIFFKGKKEAFYAQHQDELKQYGKAYHYLMKVNGGIKIDAAALKAENERLTAHRAKLQKKLEEIKPILDQLRNVQHCVDVAIRDEEPEYPSILEQLERTNQERLVQQQAEQAERQAQSQYKSQYNRN